MRAAVVATGLLFAFATAACHRSTLPHALDDRAFWALSQSLSELPGSFPLSDNLVSNEPRLAENARWIQARGGVYIGVGPEQNFPLHQSVREHGDVVQAFYGSNVAVYLTNRQMSAFCASLATLPVASGAWFIESDAVRSFHSKLENCRPGPILEWKR